MSDTKISLKEFKKEWKKLVSDLSESRTLVEIAERKLSVFEMDNLGMTKGDVISPSGLFKMIWAVQDMRESDKA